MQAYPEAYIEYLTHFHGQRDYFECHEVLEEYWKSNPDDPCRQTLVGLIQVAVSLYHQRRGNLPGGLKMLKSAIHNLKQEQMRRLGIEPVVFLERLRTRLAELEEADPGSFRFTDLDIPLADETLEAACRQACASSGTDWRKPSVTGNAFLVDKHKLRDRSEVVAERGRQQQRREQQRAGRRPGIGDMPK